MIRLSLGAALLACTAIAPASAQMGDLNAAERAVVSFAEANGCRITIDQAEELSKSAGISERDIDQAFDGLEDGGMIVIADDRMSARLVSGAACENVGFEPEDENQRQAMALFEQNGCRLTKSDFRSKAEAIGMDSDALLDAARAMFEAGALREDGRDAVLVVGTICKAAEADGAPSESDVRTIVARVFAENGCTLTDDEADRLFPEAGLSLDRDGATVQAMIDEGTIVLDDATGVASMENCTPARESTEQKPVPAEDYEKIVAAFEANDCLLTEALFIESFGDEEGGRLEDTIETMFENGDLIEIDRDRARLVTGEQCAPAAPLPAGTSEAELKQRLVTIFEKNGCVLKERSARALAEMEGMNRTLVDSAGEALDDEDAFEQTDDGLRLTIGACAAAAPGGTESAAPDLRAAVMGAFEANECFLTEREFGRFAETSGLDEDALDDLVDGMIKDGTIVVGEDGNRARLAAGSVCGQ